MKMDTIDKTNDAESGVSEVAEWFKTKNVLVTGATGFLGKVLVEKLLRSSPPEKLYLLMRPKKSRDVKERLEDFLNCQLFDTLRDTYPERLSLVNVVKGDVFLDDLGMSYQDQQVLLKECNVVFHCAANVRFDQTLKGAVTTNTHGTKRLLTFCKEVMNLEAFVHVSTAYCHCDRNVLDEVTYPAPHDPDKIIDMVQWMDQDNLKNLTQGLVGKLPNTYAYSKALSEQLVTEHSKFFPTVIARPSIVVATWKDPIPGWVENMNGPTGLIVGAGKGVIRSMHCNENYNADLIPVDICVNALVALAWKTGMTRPEKTTVVNLTESGRNPIRWKDSLAYGRKHVYNNPFTLTLWYPDGSPKSNLFMHNLCVIFFHFLPAYFIDLLLVLFRKKPFMVNVQKRIAGGLEVLQYYTIREWKFNNDNLKKIPEWLSPYDNKIFFTETEKMDWDKFMLNYVLGAREYCCKEDPASIPQARKILKRLYYLDRLMGLIFYAFGLWILWKYSSLFFTMANMISGAK